MSPSVCPSHLCNSVDRSTKGFLFIFSFYISSLFSKLTSKAKKRGKFNFHMEIWPRELTTKNNTLYFYYKIIPSFTSLVLFHHWTGNMFSIYQQWGYFSINSSDVGSTCLVNENTLCKGESSDWTHCYAFMRKKKEIEKMLKKEKGRKKLNCRSVREMVIWMIANDHCMI